MKYLISSILLFQLAISYSCKSKSVQKTKSESLNQNNLSNKTDSVTTYNLGNSAKARAFLDSVMKANGGNVSISIYGGGEAQNKSYDTSEVFKSDNIAILNEKKLDSLIKNSKKKYTYMHFWATWCGPCRNEFPELIKALRKQNNIDVLMIATDYNSPEQRLKVIRYYTGLQTEFPLYMTETKDKADITNFGGMIDMLKNYSSIEIKGIPYNVLIENESKKMIYHSNSFNETIQAIH